MNTTNKEIFYKHIKDNDYKISLDVGEIKLNKKPIGHGANGVVYEADIYDEKYALKFLLSEETGQTQERKNKRFLAEYFNIMTLSDANGIVKYVDYDTLTIDNDGIKVIIPIIIMKKYNHSLKVLEGDDKRIKFEDFFQFLIDAVERIHKQGIIHRDLKPKNILVNEKGYVLADFGIASYNPAIFELKRGTQKDERLGNRLFSAPEQENKDVAADKTMDIYAIGQILHWLIFSEPHKGTNRRRISSIVPELSIYDNIIDKCLCNEPVDRFQTVEDIKAYKRRWIYPQDLRYM